MNLINQLIENWYKLELWEKRTLVGAVLCLGCVLLISKCHGDVAILNG